MSGRSHMKTAEETKEALSTARADLSLLHGLRIKAGAFILGAIFVRLSAVWLSNWFGDSPAVKSGLGFLAIFLIAVSVFLVVSKLGGSRAVRIPFVSAALLAALAQSLDLIGNGLLSQWFQSVDQYWIFGGKTKNLLNLAAFVLVLVGYFEALMELFSSRVILQEAHDSLALTKISLEAEVAERKQAERELAEVRDTLYLRVQELEEATKHIRALQGILPICMYCHKIRDDQASWQKLENYLLTHADVRFSHGLCPDCIAKHHPDGDVEDES